MSITAMVEYIFLPILSVVGTLGVSYMKRISESLSLLTKNVMELNSRMELLASRVIQADESIKDHEDRLRFIESKTR